MFPIVWTFLAMLTAANCESSPQIPEPVCGQISLMLDNCFHNTTPKMAVDVLYTVKIPETLEEISSRCMVFNRGMDCVQHYLNACVDAKERKIIENEVYGARKLYEYLCRDKSFQREFLKHKACFRYMHNDWDSCSRNFISILKEEMARTTQESFNVQYMHFCCARFGYETCVFTSATYKCKLESAIFLKKIAKLLSTDRHFLNCDRLELELCSAGRQPTGMPLLVAVILLLRLLLLMDTSGYGRLV
ncbi:uncharacterized protein LOC129719050 [Wyeomyia smithii]|uniref:uncharacterized protein LOC129719050 n=1 Tax=Wyeomyia smithii TaxID=174621 RepID=UPI002467F580|nr:uncharacterized protein LOC129719050 [Wyeomyia smithii]XP_055526385.1 uncharacterized protein LOC129719050 [Wyeomyia smithii]XP_055526386.1 uncharacterized protein LOC129719050 [Wyeomyia smithii]XP_055526387.1 uncharacterized protein LOC129719050 [Wyeomyia smithii]